MHNEIKARDPLIEACKSSQKSYARVKGLGTNFKNFVAPIFRNTSEELLRLIKAACLLHDLCWRAHPDYRAEVCFDHVTRANLVGLKHSERIFWVLL